jgi:hypothetical protein
MAKLVVWVGVMFMAATGAAFAQSAAPKASPAMSPTHASNQFTTEQAARSHCPGDTIVWATLSRAKVYHASGDRYYGKTRRGAYMCQKDAAKAGMHQARIRSARSAAAGKSASPSMGASPSPSMGASPSPSTGASQSPSPSGASH